MSNIMAAIGLEQLKKMNNFGKKRKNIAIKYDNLFSSNNNIASIERDYINVVPHIYVIRIKNLKDRDSLREAMYKKGIEIGIHYNPNHFLTFFKTNGNENLPVTERVYKEIISLPIHPDIDDSDVDKVVSTLNNLLPGYIKDVE